MNVRTLKKLRMDQARAAMKAAGYNAILISNPENRQYLSGFRGHDSGLDTAGRLFITVKHAALFTDSRYTEQATEEAKGFDISEKRLPLSSLILERMDEWGIKGGANFKIGVESRHMTIDIYDELYHGSKNRFELVPFKELIEPLRIVKDQQEIALTQKATDITCETFAHLRTFLKTPGLTEQDVAAEIVATMLRLGAENVSFDPIVACGANGARPHAIPGPQKLKPGEPIVIDMGAKYQGYCADMTRTVFLDYAPDIWQDRYNQVLESQTHAENHLRAGISGREADEYARSVLAKYQLAEFFTHSLGHGTGLEIHEAPSLSARAPEDQLLPAGAIVTIEPGIYLSGEGGIRIEDAAVLTSQSCVVLTTAPKSLESMIIKRK